MERFLPTRRNGNLTGPRCEADGACNPVNCPCAPTDAEGGKGGGGGGGGSIAW